MTNPSNDNSVLTIESNSIEYVPPENRHGKPADLFTLWFCTNVAPLAVISGATSVLAQCQGSTADMPLSGYYATQAWVQKHPKTALAFQRAIEKAQAAANASPALVRQVIPTYTKITPATAAHISLPYYPPTLEAAQVERVVALMQSAGLVSSSFSLTPMLFHPGG